jgi:hypothetical protein
MMASIKDQPGNEEKRPRDLSPKERLQRKEARLSATKRRCGSPCPGTIIRAISGKGGGGASYRGGESKSGARIRVKL